MATLTTTRPTNPVPPRKIRFAPLPDPHRAVLITDNGGELPIPADTPSPPTLPDDNCSSSSSSSHVSSSPPASDQDKCSPASSVGSSPITIVTSLPAKASYPRPQNPPAASTSWLLKPFKRSSVSSSGSSSHSLTPTPSISQPPPPRRRPLSLSTDDILSLGTINLFRTSSRDSTDTTSGWSLARWANSGGDSTNSSRSTLFNGSSPLARAQSNQSYKPKSTSIFSTSSSSISSGGGGRAKSRINTAKPPVKATNRHKGMRMLNGRVYGAPRRNPNANPFANAPDEEPEFVEWGYGGMGSVKGAKSAGVGGGGGVNWERLHGGSVVKEGGKTAGDAEEEEDDGSGMAWLRKRREERERKAKEEKERAEKGKQKVEAGEGVGDESQANTSTLIHSSTLTELSVIPLASTTVDPPPPETTDEQEEIKKPEQDVPAPLETPSTPTHVLEAVTIPMRPRHGHSHSHSFSKTTPLVSPGLVPNQSTIGVTSPNSGDSSLGVPLSMRAPSTATLTPSNVGVDAIKSPVTSIEKRERTSSLSSSSTSSDEGDDDEDNGSDDEDEDEEGDEMRKTSLCAGIEKISRHKE